MFLRVTALCGLASLACTPLDNLDAYSSGAGSGGRSSVPDAAASAAQAGRDPGTPTGGSGGIGGVDVDVPAEDAGKPRDAAELPDAADTPDEQLQGPRIASAVPPDGASGVRRETSLSVAFSAPMDRASVEAAFVFDTLPNAAPAFQWDAGGTLLNISFGEPLPAYAAGNDPSQVVAASYTYRFTSAARDVDGNALPESSFSFSTLREIRTSTNAAADAALTGNWRSDGIYGTDVCAQTGASMCIGDSSFGPNASYRAFISFNLPELPAGWVEISRAELDVSIGSVLGAPFAGLGQLSLAHVSFAAIGPEAFGVTPQSTLGSVANAGAGDTLRFDVLSPVQADVASGGLPQYRLAFQTLSDGDGATDLLFANRAGATLSVTYLVP